MPPRKSDPAGLAAPRKSDASTARFALIDDFKDAAPPQNDQSAPAHVASTATAAETSSEPPHESGDKREKKTYAIEV